MIMSVFVRQMAPMPLSAIVFLIAGLIALPLLYVTYSAITVDAAVWERLWNTRVPELALNTISLALGVALVTLCLGISTAWLLTRYTFRGRGFWEWALVLPLAIPSYVLAYVYTFLLDLGGPIERIWQALAGPEARVFSPYTFWGVLLVMTLNTFPFVYLLSRSAFLTFNVSYEEAARVTGASKWRTFFFVSLPLIRPALVAGLFLVTLYVVSDFGAVSLLRFQTFTYAVYQQISGRFDYHAASALSLLLVAFAIAFLSAERWFRRKSRFYQTTGHQRPLRPFPCSSIKTTMITGYLAIVFIGAFALPTAYLAYWTVTGLSAGTVSGTFLEYLWNSLTLSATAATLALCLGTPVAYLASRYPSKWTILCLQGAYSGYVLPGPVAALALMMVFMQGVPFLYGTVVVLILAYLIHFLPAGLQAMESSLHQVAPNLEEAARSLGHRALHVFRRITFPLVRGGFFVAWMLMFIQAMKELPATLLLRPVGFDTLAVRIWLEASEELYQLAAPPALLIILVTAPIVFLLSRNHWQIS